MKKKTTTFAIAGLLLASQLAGCGAFSRTTATDETTLTSTQTPASPYVVTETAPSGGSDSVFGSRKSSNSTNGAYDYETATDEADAFWGYFDPSWAPNTESYEKAPENGFFIAQSSPLSTFSASVDTASYANVRRMIEDGYRLSDIYPEAVRAEEFINYFHYDLNLPEKGDKFGVTTELAACPWNENHKLLMVGMRTEEIDWSRRLSSNLVFLIDVSGSMADDNKLPLLVKSFKQLAENLTEKDRVSIVTYASGVETVLSGASGDDKETIFAALDSLVAMGATYGEGGIQRAYECAELGFIDGGVNRVIIATDGDLNVGVSSPAQLQRLIEDKRKSGVYLSVLGFGMGNYKDDNLARLANYGNGNYAYIDSLLEAKKVLVEEMGATLVTVANDVKLQVEFNPAKVNAYRLIGYENRMLEATDFNDDQKDAAEIGAGHQVVALYEIIETGSADEIELKYGDATAEQKDDAAYADEYATVKIRYKDGVGDASKLYEKVVDEAAYTEEPSDDFRFASLAAQFAMVLSNSSNKGSATLESIMQGYRAIKETDEYKEEFYYLVRKLSGRA